MDKNQIRKIVKEVIEDIIRTQGQIKETDLVSKTKTDWEETKKDLKDTISQIIKDLEIDDYKEGLALIDKALNGLKTWKNKINKNI